MSDFVPMSRDGYEKIKNEIDQLEAKMPEILEKLAAARDEGDLKENAEYHGQREAQGQLQARINDLKSQLARAEIVDMSKIDKDKVAFGAVVTVKDLDLDDEETITLVGAGSEDYNKGRYLITSPIGQGLLGKKVGEVATIQAPKTVIRFEVVKIEYDL
ncbi:MAG: transcription elongation factor GreA, partial [bacterium]|nr:transcription elongation factor GreA [bacterium]